MSSLRVPTRAGAATPPSQLPPSPSSAGGADGASVASNSPPPLSPPPTFVQPFESDSGEVHAADAAAAAAVEAGGPYAAAPSTHAGGRGGAPRARVVSPLAETSSNVHTSATTSRGSASAPKASPGLGAEYPSASYPPHHAGTASARGPALVFPPPPAPSSSSPSHPHHPHLPLAPSVTLPAVPLPHTDVIDVRAGDRGWRNIPDAVRDAVASLVDTSRALAHGQHALAAAVGRRAGHAETSAALATRAGTDQLAALTRYIQTDVLRRLDSPCPAHATANRTASALTARVAQLEAVVEAQDKALGAAARETAALKARLEKRGGPGALVTAEGLEARLAELVASLPSRASVEAAARETAEGALAGKADVETVRAACNDIEVLADAVDGLRDAAERVGLVGGGAAAGGGGAKGGGAKGDPLGAFPPAFRSSLLVAVSAAAKDHVASLQGQVEALASRVDSLWGGVGAPTSKGGMGGGSAHAHSHAHAGDGGSASALAAKGGPLHAAADAAVRSRMASLTLAVERQISTLRTDVEGRVRRDVEELREELSAALRNKAGKGDLARAASARPTAEAVRDMVRADVGPLEAGLRRKADAADVGVLQRNLLTLEATVAQLALGEAGAEANAAAAVLLAGGAALGGGGPTDQPPPSSSTTSTLAHTVASTAAMRASIQALAARVEELRTAALSSVASAEARLRAEVAAAAEAAEAGVQRALAASVPARVAEIMAAAGPPVSLMELDAVRERADEAAARADAATNAVAAAAAAGSTSRVAGGRAGMPLPAQLPAPPAALVSASAPPMGRWVWKNRRLSPYSGGAGAGGGGGALDSSSFLSQSFLSERTGGGASAARAMGLVVWDVQAANTAPDAFLWAGAPSPVPPAPSLGSPDPLSLLPDAERAVLVAVRPGLYRVSIGFFALVPPMLTLLVDGQPALSLTLPAMVGGGGGEGGVGAGGNVLLAGDVTVDSEAAGLLEEPAHAAAAAAGAAATSGAQPVVAAVPLSAGAAVVCGGGLVLHRHPAGSVAGVSATHFLALPARAKVSVVFAGQVKGQGFVELQKL
jgi:hypothetical protein